jgi:hypothetical protein
MQTDDQDGDHDVTVANAMRSRIRAVMGNGMSNSLASMRGEALPGRSVRLAQFVQNFQRFYGAVLDTQFRDNAFFHAADRAGFRTPESVHMLVMDPEYRGQFYHVSQRANANAIDYSLMWQHDNKVRRLIFFYAWIKGSSKWTVRRTQLHPIQAQIDSAMGYELRQRLLAELGSAGRT